MLSIDEIDEFFRPPDGVAFPFSTTRGGDGELVLFMCLDCRCIVLPVGDCGSASFRLDDSAA